LGAGSTISLGGGVLYRDLALVAQNGALYLKYGNKQIGLDWYGDAFTSPNPAVAYLQIVIEGTRDYNGASQNPMNNRKVQVFDFAGLVAAFDAARAAGENFSMAANLPQFRLWGSDSEAIGGAVAYQYARSGSLGALSHEQMRAVLRDPAFAVSAQPIAPEGTALATENSSMIEGGAMAQTAAVAPSDDTAAAADAVPPGGGALAWPDAAIGSRVAGLPDEWFESRPVQEGARSVAAAWRRIARELPAHLEHGAAWDGPAPIASGVRASPAHAIGVRAQFDGGLGLGDAAAPRLRQFEGLREGFAAIA
jgi:hypothetical protein